MILKFGKVFLEKDIKVDVNLLSSGLVVFKFLLLLSVLIILNFKFSGQVSVGLVSSANIFPFLCSITTSFYIWFEVKFTSNEATV